MTTATEAKPPGSKGRLEDRVALVIANQLKLARDLVDNLRARGIKVLVALGGGDGLSLARAYRPDVIALDLDAPLVDGWTFFERLKHDPRTRHVPVLLVAGYCALIPLGIIWRDKAPGGSRVPKSGE